MSDTATTPRVRLLEAHQAPLLTRPYYANGDPGPIVAALAQVPELAEVALPFIGKALGASSVSFRAKEIVILRTSALLACRYCVDTHTPVARDAGLSREEVTALRDLPAGHPADQAFPADDEQALLAWIDAVAGGGPGAVAQSHADRLAAHFADHEVVELTVTIGTTLMLNRLCTSLQLPTSPETLSRLRQDGWL